MTLDEDLTGADVLVITSSVYFKDRAVFDVDALEELSLGDFDVGGMDIDDKTIENEFDVDDKTTEDGVTGAAPAPERERFDFCFFSSALFSGGDLPFFPFLF